MAEQPSPADRIEQILAEAAAARDALLALVASLPPGRLTEPGVVGDWSVKDVVAHLSAWHELCLGWLETGLRGAPPAVPAPGHTWQTLAQLNDELYLRDRNLPLAIVLDRFRTTDARVRGLLQNLDPNEATTPGLHAWLGPNTLADYITPVLTPHYTWATQQISR